MLFVWCFFKQETAYDMRISDWSSDVCSSDLHWPLARVLRRTNDNARFVAKSTKLQMILVPAKRLVSAAIWKRSTFRKFSLCIRFLQLSRNGIACDRVPLFTIFPFS